MPNAGEPLDHLVAILLLEKLNAIDVNRLQSMNDETYAVEIANDKVLALEEDMHPAKLNVAVLHDDRDASSNLADFYDGATERSDS